ncbi:MAG: GreA/GreB family elongation factor [bacterium]
MDKQKLLQRVIETLLQREKEAKQSLETTRRIAVEAPGAMQSKSDTTKWQMSQRAGAIERVLLETQQALSSLKRLMNYSPVITKGSVYAIIEAKNLGDNSCAKYFLLPAGGGNTYDMEGEFITVINISAPLARAFIGVVVGDEVEVKIQETTKQFNIVSIT